MIKIKAAFLEGRLLSSQSEQLKKYSKSSDWALPKDTTSELVVLSSHYLPFFAERQAGKL